MLRPRALPTLANLRSRSCIIDGEAVICDDSDIASFDWIRYRRHDGKASCKPSTCELNGDELRREPRQVRKATLGSILAKARPGIRFNEHIEGARPSSSMPARLGSKESCRRGRTRLIAQGARRIG
jgi:ATP-dependent DNA ligase